MQSIKPTVKNESRLTRVVEHGRLYFYYRPRMGLEHPSTINDISRFYMIMVPFGEKTVEQLESVVRVLVVGKKCLPSTDKHSRYWGFVEFVDKDPNHRDISQLLESPAYKSSTRPIGSSAPSSSLQCAGIAAYELVTHGARHTHLVYVLEEPENLVQVHRVLNIEQEGSLVIHVKNPTIDDGLGLSFSEKAKLPDRLQDLFADKATYRFTWSPVDPPELLNYNHVEFILVGASSDLRDEFGELGTELEAEAIEDRAQAQEDCPDLKFEERAKQELTEATSLPELTIQ